MGKARHYPKYEDIPYTEWEVGAGQIRRGKRCPASLTSGQRQCNNHVRPGFATCPLHGAGYASREKNGESLPAGSPTSPGQLWGLKKEIERKRRTIKPTEMASESAATVWVVLDKLANTIEQWSQKSDVTPAQMRMLAEMASRASKTAKELAEINTMGSLTMGDLMVYSREIARLLISLAQTHVPKEQRGDYVRMAEEGLLRIFGGNEGASPG